MKNSTLLTTLLTITSSMLAFDSSAEIYTWVDEDGRVHYSDKPVDNQSVSVIKPEINNNISKPTSTNSQWQQDYNIAKEQKTKQSQEKDKIKANNKKMCDQAKSELAIYNEGGRLYLMSATGERDYQSDKQLSAQKNKYTKLIKKHCR